MDLISELRRSQGLLKIKSARMMQCVSAANFENGYGYLVGSGRMRLLGGDREILSRASEAIRC